MRGALLGALLEVCNLEIDAHLATSRDGHDATAAKARLIKSSQPACLVLCKVGKKPSWKLWVSFEESLEMGALNTDERRLLALAHDRRRRIPSLEQRRLAEHVPRAALADDDSRVDRRAASLQAELDVDTALDDLEEGLSGLALDEDVLAPLVLALLRPRKEEAPVRLGETLRRGRLEAVMTSLAVAVAPTRGDKGLCERRWRCGEKVASVAGGGGKWGKSMRDLERDLV